MPGVTSELNLYRAELAGLLGPAVGLQCLSPHLTRLETPQENSMVIGCANICALEKTVVSYGKVKVSWKSVDIITQLLNIWCDLPIKPCAMLHVYEHRNERIGTLTFLETLKVQMNSLAKRIVVSHLGQSQHLPPLSILDYGMVTDGEHLVSSRLQHSLCDAIHCNTLMIYLAISP